MKNKYLDTLNKQECNGCGACTLVCPVNAISLKEDEEGFLYPKIDESICINCGKCKKICSNYNNSIYNSKAYMSINKNKEELLMSASGGFFMILAHYVINKSGVVFGVEYDDNMVVRHNYATTIEECKKFQGSKYVRSNLGSTFLQVEKFLKDDKWVLFTGTPCQNQGLKTFLSKDYEKLITCDIICHANPSQKVFNKYIEYLEREYKEKVKDVEFRSKENGWSKQIPIVKFNNGKKIENDLYMRAFSNELIGRPSCHKCQFASAKRISDFTMGDFWGVGRILQNVRNDDKGISLITVNSKKGEDIFKNISSQMEFAQVDLDKAFKYNHNKNVKPNKNRQRFFDDLDKMPIEENIGQKLKVNKFVKKYHKMNNNIKNKIKKIAKKYVYKI